MGYVEAVRAVWMLYTRGKLVLLDEIGLESHRREGLESFAERRGNSEELSGVEALALIISTPGVYEACRRLVERFEDGA